MDILILTLEKYFGLKSYDKNQLFSILQQQICPLKNIVGHMQQLMNNHYRNLSCIDPIGSFDKMAMDSISENYHIIGLGNWGKQIY